MQNPNARLILLTCALATLCGCSRDSGPPPLLGTLEWDRIVAVAEVSEPILEIMVKEGDQVAADQVLMQLDSRRSQAQFDAAQAETQRLNASLDELRHGARAETIDASRASLARTQTTVANAKLARDRAADIRKRGLNSQVDLDNAETALRQANADANVARANLAELLHGTRPEDLAQGEASLAAAQANAITLKIQLDRLSVHAPRAGHIDTLPFKLGDRPPAGASVVSLLVGDAPYARVFVPEPRRANLQPGARFSITVDGVATPFNARLARIASEPTFTPYYALTGDDASRLTYRAELVLDGDAAKKLPAGVPCQARALADKAATEK